MSANRFGHFFQITSFGESHGAALGVVIEGCPAGIDYDENLLLQFLKRRQPGQNATVTARAESDTPEILSGIYEGRTLGTPITVIVRNHDARSGDYKNLSPRAGHADDVWLEKFQHSDPRGGGRSSGRETLARVIGGAFAQMLMQKLSPSTAIVAFPRQIGSIIIDDGNVQKGLSLNISENKKSEIDQMLLGLKTEGDSVGGIGEVWVQSPPKSLGQPVFHKLKSDLAAAYMSIGATTGVELGDGFSLVDRRGTEVHTKSDGIEFLHSDRATLTEAPKHLPLDTNHQLGKPFNLYGGIRGGLSTGETIAMRVAFKPTSSILDVAKKGRHDPCIVIRALPVLEAMTWLVLADHILWQRLDRV